MKDYQAKQSQVINYEKLNQAIASVPKHEQEMAQKVINAYAEGFAAGCHLRHKSGQTVRG